MDNTQTIEERIVTPELFFLITKFLANGPLQDTAKVLVQELEEKKVLPKRTDWLGNQHEQTFRELENKYSHIGHNHLLEICCRIGPILDKELAPSVPGIISLLGSGRQSLLRTKDSVYHTRSLLDYCTRYHGVSLPDSSVIKPIHNYQKVLTGREYGGPVRRKLLVPTSLYGKTKLLRRTVGHLSSVYCVLFDRTGRYIITGADDLLIKIWSATDGRLLATLRGASAEITDIAINLDNTMLAAGSLDRILRVWDLQSTSPIAVLSSHTGMITSVNFCPSPRGDLKYLVTTSTDGSIAFWQYSTPRGQKVSFAPKPTQFHEKLRPGQAQMMCTSFSPGGIFLAAGSADHHVRVYLMSEDGPKRILESEAYTDAVDSVQWSHRGLRFISGSKDGTAHVWSFESQQWKSVKLCMSERLPTCPEPEEGKKLKVTMVAWDCSDKYVITAVNDFTIKIWNSKTAKLHRVLRGHKDELYVLETNPKDEHVLLSAGHDGQVFLWDIEQGISVAHFVNDIDGQGHGGVFDAKWSPDGTMIAATDSHGHILIFGLGIGPDKYKILPNELFFHTDYRPLLRDTAHHVVDEQTQIMPHLMPPPFLVDADGNPHPAKYQRYVPGRENCSTDQLIPNLTIGADGVVIEDNGGSNYSQIDRLIAALQNRQGGAGTVSLPNNASNNHSQLDLMNEALANRQGQEQAPDSNNTAGSSRGISAQLGAGNNLTRNGINPAIRRLSEANSIPPRQGTTWGRPPEQQIQSPLMKYVRRIYIRPMKYAQLQNLRQNVYASGNFEMQEYKRELRRRPIMINTSNAATSTQGSGRQRSTRANGGRAGRRRGQPSQPAYRTRAVREEEESIPAPPEEDDDSSATSGDTNYSNAEENLESSDDSDTESSDYSDWVADTPGPNLEPPKRCKRKPLSRRHTLSDDSSDETEQASTSAAANASRRNKRSQPPTAPNGEISELYRPSEWLSEVIPRKAPYYPQMGDEVVYFRQGHQRYLEAVNQKKVYKLTQSSEPWNCRTLRDHELVRVIGIKYEIRPPRLCCLKLAMVDEDGNMTGSSFKIKYHDMPDVLDFLVLRQTFELAVQRNWNIGDRFRCMIGDGWWMGQIESRHALATEFPNSYFMCFRVRWDNGEYEYMSPWDMEPIDENRLPDEVGGAVPVLPEEIRATLYQPKSEEWHRGDRDGSCRRIINGFEQVMRLSIAEHFLAPVDLNIYPDYAYLIEYPIDLTTIKSRFENHFYRRITSAQFDVRYLATNAEKYNRSHTNIIKHARIITELCLRIIRELSDIDVAAAYHQYVDFYHSSETENERDSDVVPSTSTGATTPAAARRTLSSTRRSNRIRSDGDWRSDCRQLLDILWQRPDSAPFREPVDTIEFPDYLEIISTPMDLRTVKEDLLGGNYDDPLDFAKDVRLIFINSKNYNTNKRSRDYSSIYSMTLRLSALFESHIKTVVSNWKAARRRANKNKKNSGRGSSSSPTKRTQSERNRPGPSTRRNNKSNRQIRSSDEDVENDEDDSQPRSSQRRVGRNGPTRSQVVTSNSSNRVTSSSHRRINGTEDAQPTRSSRRKAHSQELNEDEDDDEDEEEDEENEQNESEENESSSNSEADDVSSEDESSGDGSDSNNNDDDDDDHDSNVGRSPRKKNKRKSHSDDDSEESYNPLKDRRQNKKRRKYNKQKQTQRKRNGVHKKSKPTANGIKRTVSNPKNSRRGQRRRYQSSGDEETVVVSQIDESTQDTDQHTPKKKGRPPKAQSTTYVANGPSTSSSTLPEVSSRITRGAAGSRRNPAENDHSYHLPVRNGRLQESDTDSRELGTRPTRSSAKRAILEWAKGSDIDEIDSDEAEEILPTPTPTKVNGTANNTRYLNGPSTSRAAIAAAAANTGTVIRQLRTNRNTVVEPRGIDSDDDGSDDEPLASSQNSQLSAQSKRQHSIRVDATRVSRQSSLQLQRLRPHAVAISTSASTSHMTRSHATSTTSNAASSSSSRILPLSTHDHNYIGDTRPTTTNSNVRNTRRLLSRHQRNADELDSSIDPLENVRLFAAASRSRRNFPTSTSNVSNTTNSTNAVTTVEVRRGRSRYSQENSQTDAHDDDEDEDAGGSDEGTVGGSSNHTEDSSDSDDNQPLTSYVPAAKRSQRNIVKSRKTEINREVRVQRGCRNLKRPRYNEQSEDDEPAPSRRRTNDNGVGSSATVSTVSYNRLAAVDDVGDDSSVDSDDEQLISVSSRGRVRKITAKARGIFKE
ncbi:bromodomain and WD repeat-containing protein 3-like isoform X1 [Teleopsis dalmanni]|uniref:bromodomain and WD repeat-containing protein 3-like isoform X1 n=1 Tax=Teleopsis dalmanni TaxID=139649 RepID=UPI0018CEAF27|nr:bromodomain and WD repeat-containing protein 3-like isoform X1 [Teleopsis dalmanni]